MMMSVHFLLIFMKAIIFQIRDPESPDAGLIGMQVIDLKKHGFNLYSQSIGNNCV